MVVHRRGATFVISLLLAACGLDLEGIGPGGGAGAGPGVSPDGGALPPGRDGAAPTDATAQEDRAIPPSPCGDGGGEVCGDGVDNDCNGLADCADPACTTGFACTTGDVPAGWTVLAYATARDACPAGFGASTDLEDYAGLGPASCACTCTSVAPALCDQGSLPLYSQGAGACGNTAAATLNVQSGRCGSTNLQTVANGMVRIPPLPPIQGTCSPNLVKNVPATSKARACTAPAPGGGCPGTTACVPKPSGKYGVCIASAGDVACPAGWPTKHATGKSATDTRDCSTCACGTAATCANPKFTFYTDGACTAGAHDLTVDNVCDSVNDGSGHPYSNYKYTATVVNGACAMTAAAGPTGAIAVTGAQTICCP